MDLFRARIVFENFSRIELIWPEARLTKAPNKNLKCSQHYCNIFIEAKASHFSLKDHYILERWRSDKNLQTYERNIVLFFIMWSSSFYDFFTYR